MNRNVTACKFPISTAQTIKMVEHIRVSRVRVAAWRKAGMILLEAPISAPHKPKTFPESYQGFCSTILFREAPYYRHRIRVPIDM